MLTFTGSRLEGTALPPSKNDIVNVRMNKGIVNVSEDRGWNKVPNFSYHA